MKEYRVGYIMLAEGVRIALEAKTEEAAVEEARHTAKVFEISEYILVEEKETIRRKKRYVQELISIALAIGAVVIYNIIK